ncbi:hypothetical protein [Burkholderia ubonensis]|uniref:hypothetical protein n=1 Tax=Burkholderia ubonensis TaxID=101571 RepID=UPI000A5073CA|nr:hypothetical protein [Burkholderia ubonensis]
MARNVQNTRCTLRCDHLASAAAGAARFHRPFPRAPLPRVSRHGLLDGTANVTAQCRMAGIDTRTRPEYDEPAAFRHA